MPEEHQSAMPVLLVEDNELDVEMTQRVLSRLATSVRLVVARDGREALDVLLAPPVADELPRLVLLDLRLPGVDGRDVLRRIKNDPQLCIIPVVVLTGLGGQRPLLDCMELGGNMFFVKPLSEADAAHVMGVVQRYWQLMDTLTRRPRAA